MEISSCLVFAILFVLCAIWYVRHGHHASIQQRIRLAQDRASVHQATQAREIHLAERQRLLTEQKTIRQERKSRN